MSKMTQEEATQQYLSLLDRAERIAHEYNIPFGFVKNKGFETNIEPRALFNGLSDVSLEAIKRIPVNAQGFVPASKITNALIAHRRLKIAVRELTAINVQKAQA